MRLKIVEGCKHFTDKIKLIFLIRGLFSFKKEIKNFMENDNWLK